MSRPRAAARPLVRSAWGRSVLHPLRRSPALPAHAPWTTLSAAMPAPIVHNTAAKRFEATVGSATAVLEYEERGPTLVFTHTRVPEALGGRGLAAALVEAALAYAQETGRRVVPECSYVAAYFKKHPEHAVLLAGAEGNGDRSY